MTCRGICIRHKSKKIPKTLRYGENEKRCQVCDIFIKWTGLFCPCCGYRLRHNARIQKYKIKKYIE